MADSIIAPAPQTVIEEVVRQVPYLFNILSVFISIMPYLVLSVLPMNNGVRRYFTLKSFMMSAIMNFLFVCHILFVREKNETLDTLYVTMIGMTLGTVCSFMWLLRDVIVNASISARVWMVICMGALVCGSGFILRGIQADLHFSYDKGWGLYLGVAAVITAIVLNGYPLIIAAIRRAPVEPDFPADLYGLFMCVLGIADALYFVLYAFYVETFGSMLSIACLVTVVFGVFNLTEILKSLIPGVVSAANGFFWGVVACLGLRYLG